MSGSNATKQNRKVCFAFPSVDHVDTSSKTNAHLYINWYTIVVKALSPWLDINGFAEEK
jgi:hypothetical protein